MDQEFKPGLYQHHKGGFYRALFKAVLIEKPQTVSYRTLFYGRLSEHRDTEVEVAVETIPGPNGKRGRILVFPMKMSPFTPGLLNHPIIEVVVYISLTIGPDGSCGNVWARPFRTPLLEGDDCWTDLVEWPNGKKLPRFALVGD